MNSHNILYKFIENDCEIKVPITKKVQKVTSCDIFIHESSFMLVSDVDISLFECPRRFAIDEMKNISICFNSEQREYTCVLPCHPESHTSKKTKTNQTQTVGKVKESLCRFTCITDSCVLSVDGTVSKIQADFPYGFSGRYRGKPNYDEADLARICRITDPSSLSPIKRIIQRENEEQKDFCRHQYKINFAELNLDQGHENPLECSVYSFKLTEEEESILQKIKTKHPTFDVETDQINIDFELVSILLGICYDIRSTSDEPTCESHWTRTILSPVLSYFERFDNLQFVVESFLRRSLIYPLYRNYDLGRLCVQDAVQGIQMGKSWILKQLLVTYNCFCEAEFNRKALNKYFIKHYIWYVDAIMDDEHLQMLSDHLKNALHLTTKEHLRLGLIGIEMEMFSELLGDFGDLESESGSSFDSSLGYEVDHEGKIII